MKRILSSLFFVGLAVAALLYPFPKEKTETPRFPVPTNGEKYRTDQDEGDPGRREAWIELIHKAAPGTDWREIERRAARELARTRQYTSPRNGTRSVEVFANGLVEGEWYERGSKNQAGNMQTVEYVPELDKIYGVGGGGSFWRGNLDGSDWTVLNDDFLLNPNVLEAFYPNDSSHVRFISTSGKFIIYSDDEGSTWQDAEFSPGFYDGWGSPNKVVVLNDSLQTIYYLAHTWDATPWAARSWLYRSTDGGAHFERVRIFNRNEKRRVSLWAPYKGKGAYVLEGGSTIHYFATDTSYSIPVNGLADEGSIGLTGYQSDSTLILYALQDDLNVYRSNNTGVDWTWVSELPAKAWSVGMTCSPFDSLKLFSGAVNSHYSTDGGLSWELANEWWEYYDDPNLLHADIMDLKFFEKTDSTPFFLIANHGGLHISWDHLLTTQNIGLEDMNIGQYYDVVTNQNDPRYMYLGSQDQGWQWTQEGDKNVTVDFTQQWSGDYGQMLLTRNFQSFWTQYPGGIMDYYHYATNPPNPWPESEFNVEGEHMPAVNWIIPTANLESLPEGNSVFVAGGNLNGGPGSYLILLTASEISPFNISATQFDYDFRANSRTGEGLISAIEQSSFYDGERIYVTTDDGTFFASSDFGETWQKSPGFTGPMTDWIYTACILASKTDPDVVYVSGSGYSNPPVFKSTDGGMTFEPISQGLPGSVVQEIIANPDETLLFAATTLGPFVYVTWENRWYPLLGESTPLQWYTSVEYIASSDIVRYSTYGRGIWDFAVTFVEQPPVAVLENSDLLEINIFPNPVAANGTLTIETNDPNSIGFTMMDAQGKIVKSKVIRQKATIELDGLPAGNYFYVLAKSGVTAGNGQVTVF